MSNLRLHVLTAAAALLAATAVQADASGTRIAAIPYDDCLSIIAEMSEDLGEEPVVLVKTGDVRTVRVDAADGFVTVSCSRPDNKMTLTKTGSTVTAGLDKTR